MVTFWLSCIILFNSLAQANLDLVSYPVFLDKEVDLGLVKAFQSKDNEFQYYYLPNFVRLKNDPATGAPLVGFQQYVQNVKSASDAENTRDKGEGGGFFWMTVGFHLTDEELRQCQQRLGQLKPGATLVGAMAYESGSCALLSFGLEKNSSGEGQTEVLGVGNAPLMEGDAIAVALILNAANATKLYASLRLPNPAIQMNFNFNFRGFNSPIKAKIEMNLDQISRDSRLGGAIRTPKSGLEIERLAKTFRDNGWIKVTTEGDLSADDQKIVDEMTTEFRNHFFQEVDDQNGLFQGFEQNTSPLDKLNQLKESSSKQSLPARFNYPQELYKDAAKQYTQLHWSHSLHSSLAEFNACTFAEVEPDLEFVEKIISHVCEGTIGGVIYIKNPLSSVLANAENTAKSLDRLAANLSNKDTLLRSCLAASSAVYWSIHAQNIKGHEERMTYYALALNKIKFALGTLTGFSKIFLDGQYLKIQNLILLQRDKEKTAYIAATKAKKAPTKSSPSSTNPAPSASASKTATPAPETKATPPGPNSNTPDTPQVKPLATPVNDTTLAVKPKNQPDTLLKTVEPDKNIAANDLPKETQNGDSTVSSKDSSTASEETNRKPIPVSAFIGYQLKKVVKTGTKTFELNRVRPASRDRVIAFALPRIPAAHIQQINLDDPLYTQREITAILDGNILNDFPKYINFVTISVRKRHPSGDMSTPELVVDRQNYHQQGNRFRLMYGWKPGDNNRRTWLDYEYRMVWSFHGGGEVASNWIPTNQGAINLVAPCKKTDIRISGELETLKEKQVRLVQVKLLTTVGGVTMPVVKSFNVNRLESLDEVLQIIQPNDQTQYQYEIIWTLTGNRTLKTAVLTAETTELLIDELPQ